MGFFEWREIQNITRFTVKKTEVTEFTASYGFRCVFSWKHEQSHVMKGSAIRESVVQETWCNEFNGAFISCCENGNVAWDVIFATTGSPFIGWVFMKLQCIQFSKRMTERKFTDWNTFCLCVRCVEAHECYAGRSWKRKTAAVWSSLFPWEPRGAFPSLSWVLGESDTDQLRGKRAGGAAPLTWPW